MIQVAVESGKSARRCADDNVFISVGRDFLARLKISTDMLHTLHEWIEFVMCNELG